VTIIPRGMALGLTMQVPADERHSWSKEFCINRLEMMFGGRAAEELVLGHTTTGARDDIEKATDLAHRMVCEYGMSDNIGPITLGKKEEQIFLGRDFTQVQNYSNHTALEIDTEVRRILTEAYQRAKSMLAENIDLLHLMAEHLLEKEVLDGSQIDEIIRTHREQQATERARLAAVSGEQRA
jgi:cell division protease FtsH